jgi:CRISPR-associated endonuclease Cas1
MTHDILLVEGYAARLYVERGHLVAITGFPGEMQEVRFPRGRCGVDRILVRARGGTVSIEAFDWCARMGIALAFIASDSTLTNCLVPEQPHDGPLKRAQATVAITDDALPLARWLLKAKFASCIETISKDFAALGIGNKISRGRAVCAMTDCTKALDKDETLTQLLTREGYAAKEYWDLLTGTPLPWPDWCLKRIPSHWAFISPRDSGGRNRVRDARDPFNATLNYALTCLEIAMRIACASVGLDPDLGLLHVDNRLRGSAVFDLLEPLRTEVDVMTFQFIKRHSLRPHMFIELRDGIVRLDPDLARDIAHYLMPRLRSKALQVANEYAKQLRRVKVPYRLVRAERGTIDEARRVESLSNCRYCQQRLPRRGLQFCGRDCYLKYSVEVARPIDKAQAKLAEMRSAGLSPGHGGEAGKKRGAKIAESNRRRSMQLSPAELRARKAEQMRGYRAARGKPSKTA